MRGSNIDAKAWLDKEVAAGRLSRNLTADQLRRVASIVKTANGEKKMTATQDQRRRGRKEVSGNDGHDPRTR